MSLSISLARLLGAAGVVGLAGILAGPPAFAQASSDETALHEQWRDAIQHTATPGIGCFHASYPNTVWVAIKCLHRAHWKPHLSLSQRLRMHRADGARNVGGGTDWVLKPA
jgi:hypothetical protein